MRKWNVQTAAARATRVHARPPLARRGRAAAGSNLLDNTCHICGKTFSNEKILAVHIKAVHKGGRSRARAPARRSAPTDPLSRRARAETVGSAASASASAASSSADWTTVQDPSSGHTYYYNQRTGQTSWVWPPQEAAAASAAAAAAPQQQLMALGAQLASAARTWETALDPSKAAKEKAAADAAQAQQAAAAAAVAQAAAAQVTEADWTTVQDPTSGHTYYYNQRTGQTSWVWPPEAAADGAAAAPQPTAADGPRRSAASLAEEAAAEAAAEARRRRWRRRRRRRPRPSRRPTPSASLPEPEPAPAPAEVNQHPRPHPRRRPHRRRRRRRDLPGEAGRALARARRDG